MTLRDERRQRLVTAMAEAGIAEMVLYGNAWQGDYLRYASDFGILEGHGIAIISADGSVELFVDSAVEAERAEAEVPGIKVAFARDIARAVGTRLDRVANHRLAAAPRRFVPKLDFVTTPGYLSGPGAREAAGLPAGTGPYRVITDLAVMGYHEATKRM